MANRILLLVNLMLASIGIYFGVVIFYAAVTAGLDVAPLPPPAGPREAPAGAAPLGSLAEAQVIVDRNLFNSGRQAAADVRSEPAALDVDALQQTGLKLRLWGTVAGPDGQAYAVIEDPKSREQQLVRPGDPIQNASVKLILRHRVVLTVNGRDEVLLMEEPGVARASAPGAAVAEAALSPRMEPVQSGQEIAVAPEQIAQAIENIGDLLSQATFRPHIEDGRQAGISITGIKPNAIFRRLRLRNGDVITGVNGQPIATVEDAMSVFGGLSMDGPIQVNIKRRGREETLEYRIE